LASFPYPKKFFDGPPLSYFGFIDLQGSFAASFYLHELLVSSISFLLLVIIVPDFKVSLSLISF